MIKSGAEIVRALCDQQLDTEYIQQVNFPTSSVSVELRENGQPEYTIFENVAWDNMLLPDQTCQLAQRCRVVCFGSLAQRSPVSRQSIHAFLSLTDKTCMRILDMNLRQRYFSRAILESSLLAATAVKLNHDELAVLQDMYQLPADEESALKSI